MSYEPSSDNNEIRGKLERVAPDGKGCSARQYLQKQWSVAWFPACPLPLQILILIQKQHVSVQVVHDVRFIYLSYGHMGL